MEIRFVSSRDTAVEQDAELPAPVARVLDFSGRLLRGRYRLRRRIGIGGMGAVYEARDQVFETTVAVKLIHPELARDPEFRRRFLQEARLGALLRHRHSVAVSDVGETEDGVLFLVMEHLEGEGLDITLAGGPLPWRRVCTIAAQLCEVLAEAHDRGVVHRDIKPGNCFLLRTDDGADVVKLLDLGLAKLLPAHRGLVRGPQGATGRVVGTPEYMAPEQALGLACDHRVDIYGLGVTMYRLLTGHLPFVDRSPAMLLRRQIDEPPRPLRQRVPELPTALEAVVLRALAKRPDDRFQGARELGRAIRGARELAEFELAEIVAEDAPARPTRLRLLPRRRVALGVGLALALVAVVILALRRAPAPPPAPPDAAPQLAPATGPVRPVLSSLSPPTAARRPDERPEPPPILAAIEGEARGPDARGPTAPADGPARPPVEPAPEGGLGRAYAW